MGVFSSTLGSSPTRRGGNGQQLEPSVGEARTVAALLVKGKRIPVELVIDILNFAEYCPTMTCRSDRLVNVAAGWSGNRQSIPILQTPPIPSIPDIPNDSVQRIRVFTDSHDQGFSSFPQHQNTREASSSWFELALVRPPPPCRPRSSSSSTTAMPGALPSFPIAPSPGPPAAPPAQLPYLSVVSRIRLYSNLHANREFTPYSITIERGEEEGLIEMMEPGDRLVLYAMAQYPAWTNVVRECAIQIDMRAL